MIGRKKHLTCEMGRGKRMKGKGRAISKMLNLKMQILVPTLSTKKHENAWPAIKDCEGKNESMG